MSREKEVVLCKLAEKAKRFPDMVKSVKKMCEFDAELSKDERNFLHVGYKNMVQACRTSLDIIIETGNKAEEKGETDDLNIIKMYRQELEAEFREICRDCIEFIDTIIIPASKNARATVFYYRMKGDYHRYLAGISFDEERTSFVDQSRDAYMFARNLADTELSVTDPLRLGIALNLSALYYEFMEDVATAFNVAKKALEEAEPEMSDTCEGWYGAAAILKGLKENLTLWSA